MYSKLSMDSSDNTTIASVSVDPCQISREISVLAHVRLKPHTSGIKWPIYLFQLALSMQEVSYSILSKVLASFENCPL